jgi:hypothetical protein
MMLELYEYFDEVLIFSDPAPPYLYYSFRKNLANLTGVPYARPKRKEERNSRYFDRLSPNIAVPTRTNVAPSSTATRKSPLIPIER